MKQFNDIVSNREVIFKIDLNLVEIKELKITNMMINRRSRDLIIMLENEEFLNIRGDEYWVIVNNTVYTPNKNITELILQIKLN